jgi:prolyl 4-hydroxylase
MEEPIIEHLELETEDDYWKWMWGHLFPPKMYARLLVAEPRILKIYHFLDEKEITHLLQWTRSQEITFNRSTILKQGKLIHSPDRTSQTAILTSNGLTAVKNGNKWMVHSDAVIDNVYRRVCFLVGCLPEQIEGLMLVKYEEGEYFHEHWDFFEEEELPDRVGGQRIATFWVWLNDLEEDAGGETCFPQVGLQCSPDKGAALFWWNQRGSELLSSTLHAGNPVKKGVKWGLNIWVRYPGWAQQNEEERKIVIDQT